MSSNADIFNRIQESLKAAKDTVKLKEKIESDIKEVVSMISDLTNGAILFSILDNGYGDMNYNSSSKLVRLYKSSSPAYGFILCGYGIDNTSGYPVIVENENTLLTCNDDITLKETITDLITKEDMSLNIINLISLEDDTPF